MNAQSIEHANVLSEKTHFSALGGPKVAIFGRDDLDPPYFDVSNYIISSYQFDGVYRRPSMDAIFYIFAPSLLLAPSPICK